MRVTDAGAVDEPDGGPGSASLNDRPGASGQALATAVPRAVQRMSFIDALRGGASQLIVLHHFAVYGPMSDTVAPLAPALNAWLVQYGRFAVQAFLVLAGFLAARALAPAGVLLDARPLRLVLRRFVRLIVPFAAALALAIVLAAIARMAMDHDSIPAPATPHQVLAHLLLMHDLLDYPALSAGVWYVAIDFQLFATLTLLLWLVRGLPASARSAAAPLGFALVAVLALASLFLFNRDARWDESSLYFFGSYASGAFVWWTSRRPGAGRWLALMALAMVAALVVDFRARIAVALLVALALAASLHAHRLQRWCASPAIGYLGRIGYPVFLLHFPVLLVVGAAFHRLFGSDPFWNALGIGVAWASSLAAGALFHRFVERPAMNWSVPHKRDEAPETTRAPAGAL